MPSLMWWKRWAYKPVGFPASETEPVEEADEKEPSSSLYDQNPRTTSIITTTITTAGGLFPLVATASAVAFFLLFLFMPRPWLPSDHPHQVRQVSCGNSSQEATMAGCKFDIMSYTWLHPDCFDQQLMYEFLGESDWNWYLDEEGTQSLALNDVAGGQHEYVYVTWQYYITHCTYMWKKMHRSLMTSRELDSYVANYRHTNKCQSVLLDRELELENPSVMLVTKYPSCPVSD